MSDETSELGHDNAPAWPLKPCEHEGCAEQEATGYWYDYDTSKEPDVYLCYQHVHDGGFCWACGGFWAGVEDFEFDRHGLCSNCRHDPDYNDDIEYEDDDDLDFGWDMYPNDWYDGSSLAELEDAPTHKYIGPGGETAPDGNTEAVQE